MAEQIIELEVYLVRHAESVGNVGYGGNAELSVADREDPVLTEKGLRQSELLGQRFKDCPLDCILSSGLRRTLSTVNEVVKAQPENGAKEIEILPSLAETGISHEYSGFTLEELKENYPVKLAEGIETDRMVVSSAGTDDYWNLERANQIWKYIRKRFHSGEKIIVAAHGNFNTSLFLRALNLPPQTGFDVAFTNTSVTKFVFFKKGTGRYGDDIKMLYHNETSHLAQEFPEVTFMT